MGIEIVDGFASWTRVRADGIVLGHGGGSDGFGERPWQCHQMTHLLTCAGGLSWERFASRGDFGDGPG